jgi:hypothetical protein
VLVAQGFTFVTLIDLIALFNRAIIYQYIAILIFKKFCGSDESCTYADITLESVVRVEYNYSHWNKPEITKGLNATNIQTFLLTQIR